MTRELLPPMEPTKQEEKPEPVTPPRNYDSLFDKYRGDIPLEYMRALALVSGNGDYKPNQSTSDSAGLFMISLAGLAAYNKSFKKDYKAVDLADIQLNTQIAVWLINNVKRYFSLHYPKSLPENWKKSTYVAILTLGFKIGHSENGGIGDAIKFIENMYPEKITIDMVAQVAKEKGLATYLYSPKWIAFAKHVANLYAGSPKPVSSPTARAAEAAVNQTERQSAGSGIGIAAAAIVGIPLLLFFGMKRR